MEPGRLTKALTMTVQIIISLVMFIIVLPFFIIWRVPISLLYFTKKEPEEPKNVDQEREKEEAKEDEEGNEQEEEKGEDEEEKEEEPKPPPPADAHARALAPYTKVWKRFKDLPINKPLVTHWSRIACTLLLFTQTILSLALLEKSLVYHIPWFVAHLSNTHYKTSRKKTWWNDFLLHVAGLVIMCAPFSGLIGIGLGILYYARKVYVYGRFRKGMEKRQGGRGYEKPKKEGEDGKSGEGHGVKEVVMGVVDHVMHPHPHLPHPHLHLHSHAGHESGQRQPKASPYGYPGYSEDILFEQPGGGPYGYHDIVQPPSPVIVQPPARFDKNPYTLAGIASIWTGTKEKTKTGYDGRDTRKRNFADDIEMAVRVGRE